MPEAVEKRVIEAGGAACFPAVTVEMPAGRSALAASSEAIRF
jgi:hypothetical protein